MKAEFRDWIMAWYKIVIKHFLVEYLAIILRAGVGYELAIIISYPTSASRIIVLLKTPQNIENQVTIFLEHGIIAHIL